MGNVLQTSKNNNTYSGVSYDIGTISSSVSAQLTTPYALVDTALDTLASITTSQWKLMFN